MTIRRTTPARLAVGIALAALLATSACGTPVVQPVQEVAPGGGATSPAPSSSVPGSKPTSPAATPTASPTPTPAVTTPRPTTTTSSTPRATPVPAVALLSRGSSGDRVRDLQHRLRQLEWFSGPITGTYGAATASGVAGFQEKRRLAASGEVDRATWDRLTAMTRTPTRDEMHDVLRPGPALQTRGDTGEEVRDLQARLKQLAWFSGDVTGTYGSATVTAVRGFQGKRLIPVTGAVDQRTRDRLVAMTRTPSRDERHNVVPKPSATGLDPRCLTGRALCVSKRTDTLVWVVDGRPQLQVDVRFGSRELPTRNGSFRVERKSRDHVSNLYHTPMPYAMFFSGGQAVHYSRDFAARGYAGASHGCVNVRNLTAIRGLFDTVRLGDKVIVYR